jgi:hypothetical protein
MTERSKVDLVTAMSNVLEGQHRDLLKNALGRSSTC